MRLIDLNPLRWAEVLAILGGAGVDCAQ